MQLSATSVFGWRWWDNQWYTEVPVFKLKIHLYLCLLVNEAKNPQHLDCGRSIPATHGGSNDSPFVAGIDLPHQGVVDSYNVCPQPMREDIIVTSSLIGWAHAKYDPWNYILIFQNHWAPVWLLRRRCLRRTMMIPWLLLPSRPSHLQSYCRRYPSPRRRSSPIHWCTRHQHV